jgi:ribosomal protein S18 acetylase RimI-like enzyme
MLVRDAVPDDIPALASIHVRAFPGFFLSRMGARFVQDYYASVASDPSGWILVGETGGRIVGAAVGFGDPARFYRSYRSRPVRLLVPVLGAVVSDPRLIPLVVGNVRRSRDARTPPGDAELASLFVDPDDAGAGAGQRLLDAFVDRARTAGNAGVSLTTDADGNDRARRFYAGAGFTETATLFQGRRRLLVLRKATGA